MIQLSDLKRVIIFSYEKMARSLFAYCVDNTNILWTREVRDIFGWLSVWKSCLFNPFAFTNICIRMRPYIQLTLPKACIRQFFVELKILTFKYSSHLNGFKMRNSKILRKVDLLSTRQASSCKYKRVSVGWHLAKSRVNSSTPFLLLLPVFSLDIPGRVACSLSCTPNMAFILLARASIPSSFRLVMLAVLCAVCSFLPRRNTVRAGLRPIDDNDVSSRNLCLSGSSLCLPTSSLRRLASFARTLRPDRRLWVRLMCTSTPGFRGHLGAGVGCAGLCTECEDTVGLGGPPSGLHNDWGHIG